MSPINIAVKNVLVSQNCDFHIRRWLKQCKKKKKKKLQIMVTVPYQRFVPCLAGAHCKHFGYVDACELGASS